MVIDIHAHYPLSDDAFPERLVALMPEAGIDRICLFSPGLRTHAGHGPAAAGAHGNRDAFSADAADAGQLQLDAASLSRRGAAGISATEHHWRASRRAVARRGRDDGAAASKLLRRPH